MKSLTRVLMSAAAVGALGLVVLQVRSVHAHHAFGAEFDPNRPLLLKGPVVKVEWINPHTWIHLEVTKDGKKEIWMVEGGTPNSLLRRGLKRDSIQPGQTATRPRTAPIAPMGVTSHWPMARSSSWVPPGRARPMMPPARINASNG